MRIMAIGILALCVLRGHLSQAPMEQQAMLVELEKLNFDDLSYVDLDTLLRLRSLYPMQMSIGERVAENARKADGSRAAARVFGQCDEISVASRSIAMAHATDFREYYALLSHLRFRNGDLSFAAENRFTPIDWVQTTSWAVDDVTAQLASEAECDLAEGRYRYSYHDWKKTLQDRGMDINYREDMLGMSLRCKVATIPG